MKINKTKLYYITLTTIIGLKIVATIFQGGLSAHHGTKVSQLKLQKNNLAQEQIRLSTKLSQKTSIAQTLENQDLSKFHGIGDTIVITNTNEVASR
jgi:hypothetical protein